MQSFILVFAAVLACGFADTDPSQYFEWYPYLDNTISRHPRDVSLDRNVGHGKIFGTLGNTDNALFGRGGYRQDIFNDHRGRLQGEAYGSRVLGPNGGSTGFGGKLDWSNNNARVGADLQRQIGGRTGLTVTGQGAWNLDRNTRFYAGGNLRHTIGHHSPELGFQGGVEHNF